MLPESLRALVKVMSTVEPASGVNRPVSRFDSVGRFSAAPANERVPFGVAGGGSVDEVVNQPAPFRPGRYDDLFHEYTKHDPPTDVRPQRWTPGVAAS